MNQVKSENVLKVIRTFEKVLPSAKFNAQLDMGETMVSKEENLCGTVHCHAGWYAAAAMGYEERACGKFVNFVDGGMLMAQHLELESLQGIEIWVQNNPEIWGNKMGGFMFARPDAFISDTRPNGAKNLQDIVDHWKEVYERLVILEGGVSVFTEEKRKDITKELAVLPVDETSDVIKVRELV